MRFIEVMSQFLCLIMVFLSFSVAISQDEEMQEDSGWNSVQMPYTDKNIQVPREVWQRVKESLREDGAEERILEDFAVLPVAVQVELASEDLKTLRDSVNHRITFIEGGGSLDLFDYVSGRGPFHVRLAPQLSSDQKVHLLYISDSPGKKISGQAWGNGCGNIFDLTEKMDLFVYDEGISVTSSRKQYLHLMAGTFLFYQLVDDRLFMGYIRLKDSRYPNFNCQNT